MLVKKPIFIVAFAHGGSSLLLNLIRSHPNVLGIGSAETQQVFKGTSRESLQTRFAKLLRYLPILLAERYHVFSVNRWEPRPAFNSFTKKQIDKVLYYEKLSGCDQRQYLYKTENEIYTLAEIYKSRLVFKNLDGLIFLSAEFAKMYPDGTFIALVRNGLAVCEGHLRRGHKLKDIAHNYEKACKQIIIDSQKIPNYHIVRYEDIMTKPYDMLKRIYQLSNLDIGLVKKIRLKTTKVITKSGKTEYVHGTRMKQAIWYEINNFDKHFRPNTNIHQIKRLSKKQKSIIIEIAKSSLENFNYL